MSPKRGQPPKGADKRGRIVFYASPSEKEKIEEARQEEAPGRRVGAYVRDVVLDHAEKVIKKLGKKK